MQTDRQASSNRRYNFKNEVEVINRGLRLVDVEQLDFDSKPAPLGEMAPDTIRERLRINGATSKEIEFLNGWQHRVELNAMTSDVFVEFFGGALRDLGITKVIPNDEEKCLGLGRISSEKPPTASVGGAHLEALRRMEGRHVNS